MSYVCEITLSIMTEVHMILLFDLKACAKAGRCKAANSLCVQGVGFLSRQSRIKTRGPGEGEGADIDGANSYATDTIHLERAQAILAVKQAVIGHVSRCTQQHHEQCLGYRYGRSPVL